MDVSFMAFSRLAFGHWEGQPLCAGRPGYSSAWPQARSCADLAAELGCPAEALERLLDCAVAQKLLVCEAGRYGNSELSARFLTEDSPESLLSWIRIMDRWKRPGRGWPRRCGGAAVDNQAKWLGEDPQFMRDFILGMHQFAARSGPQFAEALKDLPVRRLIDVGGGAGTRSRALCAARQARAEILDLAPVVDITRATARAAGLADRVTARVADYRHDEFGADADALLFSNVLHQESAEVCRSMLARALRAARQRHVAGTGLLPVGRPARAAVHHPAQPVGAGAVGRRPQLDRGRHAGADRRGRLRAADCAAAGEQRLLPAVGREAVTPFPSPITEPTCPR